MAIKEQDKVFYEELANGDKVINLPVTRANNVEGLGRSANTAYTVGDVVYTDNNMQVALKCTTAGTTSNTELDISGNNVGDTVTDGTCVWNIVGRISDSVPIGTIFAFGANEHPIGYLPCDGTAVSRTVYADLFAVIGTTYGAGDGSTTFNLPNLNNNSFLEGSDVAGTVKSAGLPNVYGDFTFGSLYDGNYNAVPIIAPYSGRNNAFDIARNVGQGYNSFNSQASNGVGHALTFNAQKYNSIYGNSDTVQPKSVTVKFCIKAYGAITNAGSVELEEMAQDYEAIAQRTSVVEQTLPTKANLGALSMPSGQTIAVSALPYTAPCDGWMKIQSGESTSSDGYILLEVVGGLQAITYGRYGKYAYLPLRKGEIVYEHTNDCLITARTFVFAQSEV